jgi:hypothetical protein
MRRASAWFEQRASLARFKGPNLKVSLWAGAAECEHAKTNARAGEGKLANYTCRGGCQDTGNAAHRACHAGLQLGTGNTATLQWVVYLRQQSQARHAVP